MTRTQCSVEQFRKAAACIRVIDAAGQPAGGIPVSIEQETHDFLFGCVVPDLSAFSGADRERCRARLEDVFNHVVAAGSPPPAPGVFRVELTERVHLGLLRLRLDDLAASSRSLEVYVHGAAVGMDDAAATDERDTGARLAELYTLCFAHPSLLGIIWHGLVDGQRGAQDGGLLRRDFSPKYAHKALQKLIGDCWHTRTTGVTDATGRFRFRGFFGTYRVAAKVGGSSALVETISFHRDAQDHEMTLQIAPQIT